MSQKNGLLGPNGATPVLNGGALWQLMTTSALTQLKAASGVLERLGLNTAGTGSAVAFYDGLSFTVTRSIAAPGVVTWPAGQKPVAGTAVKFSTTGALPTGLTAGTTYYVSTASATANAAALADTQAHALAGTNSITTTGTQSGVHTAWDVSRPIGSWSTTAQGSPEIGAACTYGIIANPT